MSGLVYSAAGKDRPRRDERPLQNSSIPSDVLAGRGREGLGRNRLVPNLYPEGRSPFLSDRVKPISQKAGVTNRRRESPLREQIHQQAGVANRRPNASIYQQAGVANREQPNIVPIIISEPIRQESVRMPRVVIGREEKQVVSVVALAILGIMILPSLIKLAITIGTVVFVVKYLIGNRNNLGN